MSEREDQSAGPAEWKKTSWPSEQLTCLNMGYRRPAAEVQPSRDEASF